MRRDAGSAPTPVSRRRREYRLAAVQAPVPSPARLAAHSRRLRASRRASDARAPPAAAALRAGPGRAGLARTAPAPATASALRHAEQRLRAGPTRRGHASPSAAAATTPPTRPTFAPLAPGARSNSPGVGWPNAVLLARSRRLAPVCERRIRCYRAPPMSGTYDLMLLLDPNAPDDRREEPCRRGAVADRDGGKLVGQHDWGTRRMAFEIDHRAGGRLPALPVPGRDRPARALNQRLKIIDGVLRFRIIKFKAGQPTPPAARAAGSRAAATTASRRTPGGRPRRRRRTAERLHAVRRTRETIAHDSSELRSSARAHRASSARSYTFRPTAFLEPSLAERAEREQATWQPPTSTGSSSRATSPATPSSARTAERHVRLQPARRVQHAPQGLRTGEWVDKPNYFDVTVWGAQGENCAQYLSKGRPVAVDGRLEWREWEDKDGNKRQAVDIIADSVQFLGSREGGENGGRFTPQSDVPADTADFQQAPWRPGARRRTTTSRSEPDVEGTQEHRRGQAARWKRRPVTGERRGKGPGRRRPAQAVPVLPRQGRHRRLQGPRRAAPGDQRQGQDPLVARDRRLPAPPVPARDRRQARPRARPPALRRAIGKADHGPGDPAPGRRDARRARRRRSTSPRLPAQLPRAAQARPAGHRRPRSRRPSAGGGRRAGRRSRPRPRPRRRPRCCARPCSRSRTRRATTGGCSARSPRRRSPTRSARRAA